MESTPQQPQPPPPSLKEVCAAFSSRSPPPSLSPRSPDATAAAAAVAGATERVEKCQKGGGAAFGPSATVGGGSGGHYAVSPHAPNSPENNVCKLVEYRGAQVASFVVCGRPMICLPQAFDLFLKHLVGGLHTVYTKLKRLEIAPVVCNVEQVRILRGLGAIQPGVNRCKLLAPHEFDVLYEDCTTSSARPGRPPKRTTTAAAASVCEVTTPGDVPSKLPCRGGGFDDIYSRSLEELKHTAALTAAAAYQRCSQQSLVSAAAAAAARMPPFVTSPYHPALVQQAAMSMAFASRLGRLPQAWAAAAAGGGVGTGGADDMSSTSEDEVDSSGGGGGGVRGHRGVRDDCHSSRSSASPCTSSDKECNDGNVDSCPANQSPFAQESLVETSGVECRTSEVLSLGAGTSSESSTAGANDSRPKGSSKDINAHKRQPSASTTAEHLTLSEAPAHVRNNPVGVLKAFDQHKRHLLAELDELRDAVVAESRARDVLEKKLDSMSREREILRKKYEQERDCREHLEIVLRRYGSNDSGNRLYPSLQDGPGRYPVSRCLPPAAE